MNLYNNDVGESLEVNIDGKNLLGNSNRKNNGAYENGETFSRPGWVGFKAKGQVYRFGYSHPLVQDRVQNVTHKYIVPTSFFNRYENFQSGPYIYTGYNSPYSLW